MKTQWNKRGYVTILRYPTILIFLNLFLIFLFLNLGWVFASGEKFGFLINITQHQIYKVFLWFISFTEAVVQRCSVKKVFACNFIKKETLTQAFSCEFCEISNNTFSYRTPLVAASGHALRAFPTVMLLSSLKRSVLEEVCILLDFHNNSTMLIQKFKNKTYTC